MEKCEMDSEEVGAMVYPHWPHCSPLYGTFRCTFIFFFMILWHFKRTIEEICSHYTHDLCLVLLISVFCLIHGCIHTTEIQKSNFKRPEFHWLANTMSRRDPVQLCRGTCSPGRVAACVGPCQ